MTSLMLATLLAACVAVYGMPQFDSDFVQKMGIEGETSRTYRLSYLPYEETFKQFQRDHGKKYKNDFEESQRFAVFLSNVKYMEEHNLKFHKGHVSYYLGINQFSDMTHGEYLRFNRLGKYASATKPHAFPTCFAANPSDDPVPETMDWRKKGAVTQVKNQGDCGSCWTFSATGSIEGQNFLNTGKLLSFSEQQIVDCCHDQFCSGCNGGIMDEAFKYINQTGGLELESDYPYIAEDEPCRFKKSKVHVKVLGCTDVTVGDENALKSAVGVKGPVSVAIDAGHMSFQSYAGGVYVEPACHNAQDRLDHGVLTVGYGTDNGSDYWLVKNSWGPGWGMDGYIMMARNKQNQCGIATAASYPRTHKP